MPHQAVTLAGLQAQLSTRYEGKPWWTAEDARRALNNGLKLWNCATATWTGSYFTVTVPDDPYVSIGASLSQASRVLYNGIPLEKGSQQDFDWGIPNWRATTTATTGAPARPSYWAPLAMNLLVLYPADHAGLGSLEVTGVRATPLLTLPTDFVDLGQELHDRLLAYALHVLALKVGGQTFLATYPGWLGFLQACAAENRQFAASAFYRRALGLDQARWLKRQERPAQNPVDEALAQVSRQDNLPGQVG